MAHTANIYTNTDLPTVEALNTRLWNLLCLDPTHLSTTYSIIRENAPLYGIVIDPEVAGDLTPEENLDIIQVPSDDPGWFPSEI